VLRIDRFSSPDFSFDSLCAGVNRVALTVEVETDLTREMDACQLVPGAFGANVLTLGPSHEMKGAP
jgi:hypothetical protein